MKRDLDWRRDELESAFKVGKAAVPEVPINAVCQNIRNYDIVRTILNPSLMNTFPVITSLYKGNEKRKIVVNVNRGKFQDRILEDLSYAALVFYSVHEHIHTMQMMKGSDKELTTMLPNYLFNGGYKRNLERETNLEAVRRGFGKEFLQAGVDIMNSKNVPDTYKNKLKKFYVPTWEQLEPYAEKQGIEKTVYDALIKT